MIPFSRKDIKIKDRIVYMFPIRSGSKFIMIWYVVSFVMNYHFTVSWLERRDRLLRDKVKSINQTQYNPLLYARAWAKFYIDRRSRWQRLLWLWLPQ